MHLARPDRPRSAVPLARCRRLILLQRKDGSWDCGPGLAGALLAQAPDPTGEEADPLGDPLAFSAAELAASVPMWLRSATGAARRAGRRVAPAARLWGTLLAVEVRRSDALPRCHCG